MLTRDNITKEEALFLLKIKNKDFKFSEYEPKKRHNLIQWAEYNYLITGLISKDQNGFKHAGPVQLTKAGEKLI